MNLVKTILKDPLIVFRGIGYYALLSVGRFLSDETFLKCRWFIKTGKKLNLANPQTYNEKLQWLKLYDRRPEYTQMVDKVEAKKYAASIIGEEYIIPTLGVYDRAEDIDFDALPNQFVLKCTHDSGGIVICTDKTKLDKQSAIKKLRKGLKKNYYIRNREWPYKNVKPRIIAEIFVTDDEYGGLKDYKFFCFKGEPKFMFLLKDRGIDTRLNFYDLDFNKLPFERGYPNFDDEMERPQAWEEMINLSKKLSHGIPQVRTDFYDVNGKIYFGELTFFPGTGLEKFEPEEWDKIMGDFIELPTKSGG